MLVGVAAGRSGMHAPLAFLGAALMMGLTAMSFAELGTRMPVSASEAAYVEAAFGRKWLSLAVGLLVVATAIVSAATISAGSAGYIGVFLPVADHWIVTGVVLGMGVIACLATVQSVTLAGIMTLIEIGGLMLIIGAGVKQGPAMMATIPEIWPSVDDTTAWFSLAGTSLIAVFAFIGFEHLVNIAEEMKNPTHTLPRALFWTLGVTAIIYALVVWIAVTAVPPPELSRSPAPLALVFARLTGFPLITMSAIAVVATLNGIIVHMIMIARVLYGLAEKGSLPSRLAHLYPATGTPLLATAIGVGGILLLALAFPLAGLADITARGTLAIFALVNLALIRLKRREVEAPENIFHCPIWVPILGFVSSASLLAFDLATT